MSEIYLADTDVSRFRVYVLEAESAADAIVNLAQQRFAVGDWRPVAVRPFDEKGGALKPVGDFSGLLSLTIVTEAIVAKIGDELRSCGELFEVTCGRRSMWAYLVSKLVDCIDAKRSEISRFSNGRSEKACLSFADDWRCRPRAGTGNFAGRTRLLRNRTPRRLAGPSRRARFAARGGSLSDALDRSGVNARCATRSRSLAR